MPSESFSSHSSKHCLSLAGISSYHHLSGHSEVAVVKSKRSGVRVVRSTESLAHCSLGLVNSSWEVNLLLWVVLHAERESNLIGSWCESLCYKLLSSQNLSLRRCNLEFNGSGSSLLQNLEYLVEREGGSLWSVLRDDGGINEFRAGGCLTIVNWANLDLLAHPNAVEVCGV